MCLAAYAKNKQFFQASWMAQLGMQLGMKNFQKQKG